MAISNSRQEGRRRYQLVAAKLVTFRKPAFFSFVIFKNLRASFCQIALDFLREVKDEFEQERYSDFLDVMKEFKDNR